LPAADGGFAFEGIVDDEHEANKGAQHRYLPHRLIMRFAPEDMTE
jgi:hypothetical protein